MNYPDYKKKVITGLLERVESSRQFDWEGGYDQRFLAVYVREGGAGLRERMGKHTTGTLSFQVHPTTKTLIHNT